MEEQLFGEGFRVRTNKCSHRTRLTIDSYASARIMVNPHGLINFEFEDVIPLFGADIPSRGAVAQMFAMFGFEESPEPQSGPDPHGEQILLFSNELSLEMWVSAEFLPSLDFFADNEDAPQDELDGAISELTKQIMSGALAQQASERVRRTWQV